jgi:hypothetical protein
MSARTGLRAGERQVAVEKSRISLPTDDGATRRLHHELEMTIRQVTPD